VVPLYNITDNGIHDCDPYKMYSKIVNVNKLIDRCDGPLTPTATKILRLNSNEARKYTVDYVGDDLYQVMSLNNEAGIPEEWVHPCYRLDTWKKVYSFKIKPIRGRIHWPKCNVPTTLLPPKHKPNTQRKEKLAAESDVLKIVKN
nr:hypothetical protein [Tanacetum cinerariifolium]